jgi:RimJ/RimL family protein N-acetyltransferase/N-acetylglutamate synthase-like GNAT family acetyltransferase
MQFFRQALICQSNRILIRPWDSEDAKAWYVLSRDEGLNCFSIMDYRQTSHGGALDYIKRWQEVFNRNGLGVFPVFYKDLQTMMGVVGLKEVILDDRPDKYIELMYRFAEPFWGKGLATEAAHGLLRYAFAMVKLSEIIAVVEEENKPSIGVLQRLGFNFARKALLKSRLVNVYKISRQEFLEVSSIDYRKLHANEWSIAKEFYHSLDYTKEFKAEDVIFGAFNNRSLIGAVRLEQNKGVTVLRGMQIHYKYAGNGIGRELLKLIEFQLGNTNCYCIPFGWLEKFYASIGFKKIDPADSPKFLQERLADNVHAIIMKR